MKSPFLPSEGLLCLYDRQNNTWLLVDMEFLFSCSTRRREISYLRAPMLLFSMDHISKVLDFENDPLSCTLLCAFLFTFFLMARLANIVPRFRQCFDPSRHLTGREVAKNQRGLIVTFKCTKTKLSLGFMGIKSD